MAFLVARGVDLVAVGATVVATAMVVVYREVVEAQGTDSPLWWVQGCLLLGAVLALAGAPRGSRRRRPLLLGSTALLGIIGLLAIFTIGLPILLAAALAFVAAARDRAGPTVPPPAAGR